MIKSHGQRLDLAPCRSHQWASSCLVRIIHDGSSSPSLTLPHSMGEGEGGGPRRARGAGRKGGILKQDINRPSGEPARLGAVKHAAKCVAAANPRLQ